MTIKMGAEAYLTNLLLLKFPIRKRGPWNPEEAALRKCLETQIHEEQKMDYGSHLDLPSKKNLHLSARSS